MFIHIGLLSSNPHTPSIQKTVLRVCDVQVNFQAPVLIEVTFLKRDKPTKDQQKEYCHTLVWSVDSGGSCVSLGQGIRGNSLSFLLTVAVNIKLV